MVFFLVSEDFFLGKREDTLHRAGEVRWREFNGKLNLRAVGVDVAF